MSWHVPGAHCACVRVSVVTCLHMHGAPCSGCARCACQRIHDVTWPHGLSLHPTAPGVFEKLSRSSHLLSAPCMGDYLLACQARHSLPKLRTLSPMPATVRTTDAGRAGLRLARHHALAAERGAAVRHVLDGRHQQLCTRHEHHDRQRPPRVDDLRGGHLLRALPLCAPRPSSRLRKVSTSLHIQSHVSHPRPPLIAVHVLSPALLPCLLP